MIEIDLLLGLAIYGLVWFLTLFLVLPFGVRPQGEAGKIVKGTAASAPQNAHIKRKLLATTLLAGVFYAGIYGLLTSDILADARVPFAPQFEAR